VLDEISSTQEEKSGVQLCKKLITHQTPGLHHKALTEYTEYMHIVIRQLRDGQYLDTYIGDMYHAILLN